jgi:SAM-dependent methyltransferase
MTTPGGEAMDERGGRLCRLCGGTDIRRLMSLPGAPRTVQTLLAADSLDRDTPIELTLMRCDRCGLAQLAEDPAVDDLYSPDYLYSVNFSAHARAYQEALAGRWARDHGLADAAVLEVGGGDGFFAGLLTGLGCEVTYTDLATKACEAARGRGLKRVVQGLLDAGTFPGERFDAVVARHVLEHVPRPVEFLGLLGGYLGPGGRLFIEVPNLDGIVANGRFQDFYPEHVSYFTPRSLATALELAGLEVRAIETLEAGDYLAAVAGKPRVGLEAMLGESERFVRRFRALAEESRGRGRRLGIWGAGGRCVSLLALTGARELGISYVIDSDPNKWGRYLPATHLPVVGPEALRERPVDDLLIAATAFQAEILDQLRAFRAGGGRVGLVQPEPHWIDDRGEPDHGG